MWWPRPLFLVWKVVLSLAITQCEVCDGTEFCFWYKKQCCHSNYHSKFGTVPAFVIVIKSKWQCEIGDGNFVIISLITHCDTVFVWWWKNVMSRSLIEWIIQCRSRKKKFFVYSCFIVSLSLLFMYDVTRCRIRNGTMSPSRRSPKKSNHKVIIKLFNQMLSRNIQ